MVLRAFRDAWCVSAGSHPSHRQAEFGCGDRGRSCHRGFLLPFRFPFSGFPPGAQRKGSVVGGTQRAFSSRQAGAGSPGFGAHAGLRAAGGRSRSLSCRRAAVRRVGSNGAGRAVRGGRRLPRPSGAAGPFPFRHGHFRSPARKKQGLNGELPATKRRTKRRRFVTKAHTRYIRKRVRSGKADWRSRLFRSATPPW